MPLALKRLLVVGSCGLSAAVPLVPAVARCMRVSDHDFDALFADQLDGSGNAGRKSTEADCDHACNNADSEHSLWCIGFEFRDTEKGMCELYEDCSKKAAASPAPSTEEHSTPFAEQAAQIVPAQEKPAQEKPAQEKPAQEKPAQQASSGVSRCLRVSDHEFDSSFSDQLDGSGNVGRRATKEDCSKLCFDESSEKHNWCVGFEFRDTEKGTCELYDECTPEVAKERKEAAAKEAAAKAAPTKKLQTASTAPPNAARCLRVADHDFDRWFVEHYDQSGLKPGRKATGVDCSNACSDPSSEHHSWCVGFEFKDTEKGTCELYEGCTQEQLSQQQASQLAVGGIRAAVLLPADAGKPTGSVTPAEHAAGTNCHSIARGQSSDEWCVRNCALGNCPMEMCSVSCRESGTPSPPPGNPTIYGEPDETATDPKQPSVDDYPDGAIQPPTSSHDGGDMYGGGPKNATKKKEEKIVAGTSGNCSWVGNGASGAYCTQWPLQTVGQCRPQDICKDGGDATAHYGKDCKSLGFTRSHHTQNLNFGGCGGTPDETAADVFLYPGPKLEAKNDAFCSWVGSVDAGGAYCSQWPLQTIGNCDGADICTDGTDADPPYGVTKAHYGMSCKGLGYTREATFCSRCVGGTKPNVELLNFAGCAGSPEQRGSAVWVKPRPPYNCSGACHIY